jgi:hypothetical protein
MSLIMSDIPFLELCNLRRGFFSRHAASEHSVRGLCISYRQEPAALRKHRCKNEGSYCMWDSFSVVNHQQSNLQPEIAPSRSAQANERSKVNQKYEGIQIRASGKRRQYSSNTVQMPYYYFMIFILRHQRVNCFFISSTRKTWRLT